MRRLYIRKLVVSTIIAIIALTVLGITFQTDQVEGFVPDQPSIVKITAGDEYFCAILSDGSAKCWGGGGTKLGGGSYGDIGDDANELGLHIDPIDLGTGKTAVDISANSYHSCAVLNDGTLKCWGSNSSGMIGIDNTSTAGSNSGAMGDNLQAAILGTNKTALQVAVGFYHTCALLNDGSVKCWGDGDGGVLGQGNENDIGKVSGDMASLSTIDLGTNKTAVKIEASHNYPGQFNCAILNDGTLKCWGNNSNGQLGQDHSNDLGDGAGEMGDNLAAINLGANKTVVDIALGEYHACALLNDGNVKCWGYNGYGNLGQGNTTRIGDNTGEMAALSAIDLGTNKTALRISAFDHQTCAILNDGTVKCWGQNNHGQLGQGNTSNIGDDSGEMGDNLSPIDLGTNKTAIDIAVSEDAVCALLEDSTLKCWGRNNVGQLGHDAQNNVGKGAGQMGDDLTPVSLGTGRSATDVVAGEDHTCAILDNGSLKCWGKNDSGQLGQEHSNSIGANANELGDNLDPIDLGTGRTAVQISLGKSHTCVRLDNNTVKCWGAGGSGRLGIAQWSGVGDDAGEMGDNLDAIDLGSGKTATYITAGREHTCAVLNDSTVKCWGDASYGQLGSGNTQDLGDGAGEMGDALPIVNLGTNKTAVAVEAGEFHTCAILNDGSLKCWGMNSYGQLGIGSSSWSEKIGDESNEMGDDLDPIPLGDGKTAAKLSLQGQSTTCVLLNDGSVKCWGYAGAGSLGQESYDNLGDNPDELGNNLDPIDLGTGKTAVEISASGDNTCVVLNDGTAKCWGRNAEGQLGQGNTSGKGNHSGEMGDDLSPIDLGSGKTATKIAIGDEYVCAVLNDGTVVCWGQNGNGGLGVPNTNRGDGPNEMGDDLMFTPLDAHNDIIQLQNWLDFTCAIFTFGTVKCWGKGGKGQTGQDATADIGDSAGEIAALTPVNLGTNKTAVAIATGEEHACAILNDGKVKCWGSGGSGRLGQDSTDNLGDSSGEMAALGAVNLGTNKTAVAISAGSAHTCALLNDGTVKCWGEGDNGRLGQDSTDDLGDSSGEMAALAAVNLGTNKTATAISVGLVHTCALLNDGTVKCWGEGNLGALGQDSTDDLGDSSGEMAALAAINLGTNKTAVAISAGKNSHTCALLNDGTVKCWGAGGSGMLGQDSTDDLGDSSGEMAALAATNLGTNKTAVAISAGSQHTCALLNDGSPKCWGSGGSGRLGQDSTDNLGDSSGEMAALPAVSLGTNETVVGISAGMDHTCIIVNNGRVKCWGNGSNGALGYGNVNDIGDGSSEMGTNLAAVSHIPSPSAPTSLDLKALSDTGVSSTDNITNDTTATIQGTSGARNHIQVFSGGSQVATTTADSAGAWVATTTALSAGSISITAKSTNSIGTSAASSALTYTLDSTGPSAPSTPDLASGSDSGASNTDNTTFDNTPTFTGTGAVANANVEIFTGGSTSIGSATADGSGNWSITSSSISNGAHSITAKAYDLAGNASSASSALSVTIDTTAPSAPSTPDLQSASDTGSSNTDNLTNDMTPTSDGTSDANVSIELFRGGNVSIGSGTADGSGNWSVTSSIGADGAYDITAKATDLAGNDSSASGALTVTFDTSAPNAPSVPDLASGNDSGVSDSDNNTSDTSVTFNGTGAVPNTSIEVFRSGSVSIGTSSSDGAGNWSVGSSSLPDGTHSITAKTYDAAGNVSAASDSLSVIIDTGVPSAPSIPDLDASSDTGSSDTDNFTSDSTPTIGGTAEANGTLKLYYSGTPDTLLAVVTVDGSGNWTKTLSALLDDTYDLYAQVIDAAGNVSIGSVSLELTISTGAPVTPSVPDLHQGSDSGYQDDDDLTQDSTPMFVGTGTANATIRIYRGGSTLLGSGTANGSGIWQITSNSIPEGTHSITATSLNVVGTESSHSSQLQIVLDTTAPSVPSVPDLDANTDTGASNSDNITNEPDPKFSGTADPDTIVEILRAGTTSMAMDHVDGAGNWSFYTSTFPEGTHSVTARGVDLAGNLSSSSGSLTVVLDTTAPNTPTGSLDPNSDTGSSNSDNNTADNTPSSIGTAEANSSISIWLGNSVVDTSVVDGSGNWIYTLSPAVTDGYYPLVVKATDAAGNVSNSSSVIGITVDTQSPGVPTAPDLQLSSDSGISNTDDLTNVSKPTFSGSTQVGFKVNLTLGGMLALGESTADGSGAWSIQSSATLNDATYPIGITVTDLAGNVSAISPYTSLTVDTIAPSVPSVPNLVAASDTGESNTDDITFDTTPYLSGTADANEAITIQIGASAIGTGQVDGQGNWLLETSLLTEGTRSIRAFSTDAAGNQSTVGVALTLNIDTTSPSVGSPDLSVQSDSGLSSSDNITNDPTPTFTGTSESNISLSLLANVIPIGSMSSNGSGNWTFTPSGPMSDGTYSVTASATDTAGNTSNSSSINVNIDTVGPISGKPDLISSSDSNVSNDDITIDRTPSFYGTSSENGTVNLYGNFVEIGTTSISSNNYSFTSPQLSDGIYRIEAVSTDIAGNRGSTSTQMIMYVDNSPPVVGNFSLPPAVEGDEVNVSVQFADSSPQSQTHSSIIDWGDGTQSAGVVGGGYVTGAHAFSDNGFYNVTVTVTDAENMNDSSSSAATILNANPTVIIESSTKVLVAGQNSMSAINFVDASGDTHTATVDWGDGTTSSANVRRTQVEASHTYQVAGTYHSVITVLDDDGGESSGLLTFVVNQPEATISIPSLSGWGMAVFIILVGSVSVIRRYKAVRN